MKIDERSYRRVAISGEYQAFSPPMHAFAAHACIHRSRMHSRRVSAAGVFCRSMPRPVTLQSALGDQALNGKRLDAAGLCGRGQAGSLEAVRGVQGMGMVSGLQMVRRLPLPELVEIGVPVPAQQCFPHQVDIGAQRGMGHVLEIQLEFAGTDEPGVAFFEKLGRYLAKQVLFRGKGQRGGACEARAEARIRGVEAIVVAGVVAIEPGSRADQAHVSLDHVQQLRQFVELVFAEQAAGAGEAVVSVAGACGTFNGVLHGAEFQDGKFLPVSADPLLAKDSRAGRSAADHDSDKDQQGGEDNENKESEKGVKQALCG